jgi:hypothetical protein
MCRSWYCCFFFIDCDAPPNVSTCLFSNCVFCTIITIIAVEKCIDHGNVVSFSLIVIPLIIYQHSYLVIMCFCTIVDIIAVEKYVTHLHIFYT